VLVRLFVRCSSSLARLPGGHMYLRNTALALVIASSFMVADVALSIEQQWGNVSAESPGQQGER